MLRSQVVVAPGSVLVDLLFVAVCERGEVETGLLLTVCAWVGGRVG